MEKYYVVKEGSGQNDPKRETRFFYLFSKKLLSIRKTLTRLLPSPALWVTILLYGGLGFYLYWGFNNMTFGHVLYVSIGAVVLVRIVKLVLCSWIEPSLDSRNILDDQMKEVFSQNEAYPRNKYTTPLELQMSRFLVWMLHGAAFATLFVGMFYLNNILEFINDNYFFNHAQQRQKPWIEHDIRTAFVVFGYIAYILTAACSWAYLSISRKKNGWIFNID